MFDRSFKQPVKMRDANERSAKIIEVTRGRSASPKRRVSRTGKVYCRFGCGKTCTRGGIHSHELHHCPRNPVRKKREFGREPCVICGKILDRHYMRVHMATQHAGAALGIRSLSPVVPSTRQKVSTSPRKGPAVCSAQGPSPGGRGSSPNGAAVSARTKVVREPDSKIGDGGQLKTIDIPASLSGGPRMSPAVRREEISNVMRRLGLG